MFGTLGACTPHGEIGVDPCCEGLTAWAYDANSGQVYPPGQYGCYFAPCAQAGQYAGGSGAANTCCAPLVNVNGRCAVAPPATQPPGSQPEPEGYDWGLLGAMGIVIIGALFAFRG